MTNEEWLEDKSPEELKQILATHKEVSAGIKPILADFTPTIERTNQMLQEMLETLKTLEPYSTIAECIEKLQARIDTEKREVA